MNTKIAYVPRRNNAIAENETAHQLVASIAVNLGGRIRWKTIIIMKEFELAFFHCKLLFIDFVSLKFAFLVGLPQSLLNENNLNRHINRWLHSKGRLQSDHWKCSWFNWMQHCATVPCLTAPCIKRSTTYLAEKHWNVKAPCVTEWRIRLLYKRPYFYYFYIIRFQSLNAYTNYKLPQIVSCSRMHSYNKLLHRHSSDEILPSVKLSVVCM